MQEVGRRFRHQRGWMRFQMGLLMVIVCLETLFGMRGVLCRGLILISRYCQAEPIVAVSIPSGNEQTVRTAIMRRSQEQPARKASGNYSSGGEYAYLLLSSTLRRY